MKKALILIAFVLTFATQAFATYVVVLKDGTRYNAKAKWTVVNGKAIVYLENGQSLQLDPSLIDVPKSEQATKMGLTNASLIDLDTNLAPAETKPKAPSLGSQVTLRLPQGGGRAATAPPPAAKRPAPTSTAIPALATTPGDIPLDVLNKFELAYENTGIFDRKIVSTGGNSLRAELTIDTEDRVFNAISATSFLMVRNAGSDKVRIDVVELFMKTTTGGSAGRFQMTRADAEAIDKRTLSQQEYFVRHVIY
ncbi:MAG TPA: hypothetical protein VF701_09445 [Thermoanaerobaculia bacterium]